jgi:glyoxylase-like metal-dependent hydrolase (beta-lactamase superfamily II)
MQILRPIRSLTLSTAYIIKAAGDVVVIDTGVEGSAPAILKGLMRFGCPPETLKAILITHAHYDHTGSAAALAQLTSAPVIASEIDAPLIEAGSAGRLSIPKSGVFNRFLFARLVTNGPQTVSSCHVTQRVRDHERIDLCGGIEVIALPGHSAGQVGFKLLASGDIFVGDALRNVIVPDLSGWHEDAKAERKSLLYLADMSWQRLFVGHGKPISRAAFNRSLKRLQLQPTEQTKS